jgi:hypothetical protein
MYCILSIYLFISIVYLFGESHLLVHPLKELEHFLVGAFGRRLQAEEGQMRPAAWPF